MTFFTRADALPSGTRPATFPAAFPAAFYLPMPVSAALARSAATPLSFRAGIAAAFSLSCSLALALTFGSGSIFSRHFHLSFVLWLTISPVDKSPCQNGCHTKCPLEKPAPAHDCL
jgi:hypothetical protein